MAQEKVRDIINYALRRQRSTARIAGTTTALADDGTDTLEVLAFEMVADAIENVSRKHWWSAYHVSQDVTYTADADSVELAAPATADCELLVDPDMQPQAFDVTTANAPFRLQPMTDWYAKDGQATDGTVRNDPQYITLYTNGDRPSVRLFPVPAANRSLRLWLYCPPARISPTTAAVLDTAVLVPPRVIRALLNYWMSEEKGEELGTTANLLKDIYEETLNDAIAEDRRKQGANFDQWNTGRVI